MFSIPIILLALTTTLTTILALALTILVSLASLTLTIFVFILTLALALAVYLCWLIVFPSSVMTATFTGLLLCFVRRLSWLKDLPLRLTPRCRSP